MDRRNFLRTGGMALLSSLAAGSVLAMPSSAKEPWGDQSCSLSAMNHFGWVKKIWERYWLPPERRRLCRSFLWTYLVTLSIEDGAVNSCNSYIDFGMGVRVLPVTRADMLMWKMWRWWYMPHVRRPGLLPETKGGPVGLKANFEENYYSATTSWEEVSLKDKMPYLQKLNDKIFSLDKRCPK